MAGSRNAEAVEIKTVSWSFGTGQGTGTVGEIRTQGQLEIESNGKSVKRNADPSNPAVHVEREGNDVVKRMSELTKVDIETEPAPMEQGEGGEENLVETGEEGMGGPTEATETVGPKKRSHAKKASAAAETGEKREHEGEGEGEEKTVEVGDGEAGGGEHPAAEKKKRAKGAKAGAEGGAKRTRSATKTEGGTKKSGRPRKGSKVKKHDEALEGEAREGDAKKRGPGRPKKSDASEHPPTAEETTGDAPAARTRSKD